MKDHGSNLMFETENKVVDNVQTSSNDWGNSQMDQQVKLYALHFSFSKNAGFLFYVSSWGNVKS